MNQDYTPISCEHHEVLEMLAMSRRAVRIQFQAAEGAVEERTAVVLDVFSRNGAEYLAMNTGETVRLDRLVAVDGALLPTRP